MTSSHAVDREEVMACLDGELPPAREAEVRSHLESCESCRALAGDLTQLSTALGAWQVETPPDRVTAAVGGAMHGAMTTTPSKSWRGWLSGTGFAGVPRWALAAPAALVLLLIVWARPQPQSAPSGSMTQEANGAADYKRAFRGGPGGGGAIPGSRLQGQQGRGQGQGAQAPAPLAEPPPVQSEPAASNGPMIARTVTISVVTDHFDDTRAALERLTSTLKGMIGSLDVSGEPPSPRAIRATLKIPADKLDVALAEIRKLGKVRQESQSSEDIGDAHRDLVVRIANAKREETRLLDILSRRTDRLADVLQVEREASRVRGEIERMESEELSMRTRVNYSTVSVVIDEAYRAELENAEQPLTRRLRNALVDGWRSATESLVSAVLSILVAGPTLIVWVFILSLPSWAIWRVIRRSRPKRNLELR